MAFFNKYPSCSIWRLDTRPKRQSINQYELSTLHHLLGYKSKARITWRRPMDEEYSCATKQHDDDHEINVRRCLHAAIPRDSTVARLRYAPVSYTHLRA